MNDIEIAVSVLAVVALPLAGIGPVLLRTLPPALVAAGMVGGAGVVLLLTRAPWAAAFTLCVGAAVLARHWRRQAALRAGRAPRPLLATLGLPRHRADREGDPA